MHKLSAHHEESLAILTFDTLLPGHSALQFGLHEHHSRMRGRSDGHNRAREDRNTLKYPGLTLSKKWFSIC